MIAIDGLVEGDDRALERVARELIQPCREWGVFQITGHGIDGARRQRFERAMVDFFALPAEAKAAVRRTRDNARGYYDEELTKNRPDWKEVFDYGAEREPGAPGAEHSDGLNQWPAGRDDLRDVLLDHYDACEHIGIALLRALCVSLGVPADTLTPHFVQRASFVRLNCYAACPDRRRRTRRSSPRRAGSASTTTPTPVR